MTTPTRKPRRAKTAIADAPALAAPPLPTIKEFKFTPEKARQLREHPATLRFALPNTAPGAFAMVRPVDFNDPSTLRLLPKDLQVMAINMAMATEKGENPRNPVMDEDGNVDADKAVEFLDMEAELARRFALAYFYDPKLYPTHAEADEHGGVCVDDIHAADIRQFLFFALNPHQEGAASLATFPE